MLTLLRHECWRWHFRHSLEVVEWLDVTQFWCYYVMLIARIAVRWWVAVNEELVVGVALRGIMEL